MNKLAPIVLFTYKRHDTLKLTVEALQQNFLAEQSDLYIFSDAGKCENDEKAVKAVRDYIHSITGFKSVILNESLTNKGLAKSIIDGVSQVLQIHETVIVLEDDLVSTNRFFR